MAASAESRFRDVRAVILRQHGEIRARLRGLDSGAVAESPVATVYLRVSLLRFAALFDAHLMFEEQTLGPRIRELDAWGPAREAAMHTEHAEQRMRIQEVCAAMEDDGSDDLDFSRAVSRLVVNFLEDMAREEQELAELERLELEGIVDQMTG